MWRWSSQSKMNLCSCEKKAWESALLGFKPWPLQYQCSVLTMQLLKASEPIDSRSLNKSLNLFFWKYILYVQSSYWYSCLRQQRNTGVISSTSIPLALFIYTHLWVVDTYECYQLTIIQQLLGREGYQMTLKTSSDWHREGENCL